MNNPKQAQKKSFLHTKTFRYSLLLVVVIVVGGFVYNLIVDSPADSVSPEDAPDAAATAPDYDNLDVIGDYLWPSMSDTRDDSIARAQADADAKRKEEEAQKARQKTVPEPAAQSSVDRAEDEAAIASSPQIVPSQPQGNLPAVSASKVENVHAPKVESVGNE